MNKALKITLLVSSILIVGYFAISYIVKTSTKRHSPEETVTYVADEVEIEVFYNRPLKKDRVIFGDLVPYNEVWRTGANEATTFQTNKDLEIGGKVLKAGKYTLWTIPNKTSWQVIFNSKMYAWGVSFADGKPSREANYDVLMTEVPISKNLKPQEQFTIYFNDQINRVNMFLAWDNVVVPISLKPVY